MLVLLTNYPSLFNILIDSRFRLIIFKFKHFPPLFPLRSLIFIDLLLIHHVVVERSVLSTHFSFLFRIFDLLESEKVGSYGTNFFLERLPLTILRCSEPFHHFLELIFELFFSFKSAFIYLALKKLGILLKILQNWFVKTRFPNARLNIQRHAFLPFPLNIIFQQFRRRPVEIIFISDTIWPFHHHHFLLRRQLLKHLLIGICTYSHRISVWFIFLFAWTLDIDLFLKP